MFETLKKLGIPATVAAIVASLITIIPLIFKFDNRYAKEDDVNTHISDMTRRMDDLTVEFGKIVGTQQVIVTLMSAQNKLAANQKIEPVAATPPTNEDKKFPEVLPEPKNSVELRDQILELTKRVERSQQRVKELQQAK